jgi:nucleoside-diphosphate-sugar epimerase
VTTLVTGGNGWLPSHVVRRLARAGEKVVSYDLMEPDDYLREFLGVDAARVIFEPGDVTDRAALREAATRHGVTSIVRACYGLGRLGAWTPNPTPARRTRPT